jgi:hypothetical protein
LPPRLVHYSLSLPHDHPRPDLIRQFRASVATLREHNGAIPAVLFVHGTLTAELAGICGEHDVMVHEQGPYEQRLAALCPAGWQALARYPLLHKFLNLRELAATGAAQVLCCDCDTVFFRDVAELFDRYGGPDVVAREEVHSGRSAYGADTSFIDESLLALLAVREGGVRVPPFNLGVVLLNNGLARRLDGLDALLLDYAWRLVCWMALNPAGGEAAAFGEFQGAAEARATAGPADLIRALPYPSVNRWILDEVALWLALGHVEGLRTADFAPHDVAQNGEFAGSDPRAAGWVMCHYYSQNTERVAAWMRQRRTVTAASPNPLAGGSHGFGEAEEPADPVVDPQARAREPQLRVP